ncbi:RNA polymerase sigma factor [Puia dinghuensis]|uniref:RNA polymerase sigma factor n=1 Tax=Puia dinghuensis TaxID=1792502 RepID=A0A8J2XT31_9BACT|nr:sigma-70 family RNA polymerase sigma factor [Puia dinghuensis]GGB00053.1 RNA polymerase sigma factor [Puia dinghuensis]
MAELTEIKEGKAPAFTYIHNQYQKKLFRFFLKRTAGNHDTARELSQQTFIKLWNSRHTLSDSFSIETQLFTIASTVLVDHLRRRAHEKKRLSVLVDKMDEGPLLVMPAKEFEGSDYLQVVVRGLPPARKRIILMKMSSGFTNKEIATQLSISEKTVEDHVTKALRYLRTTLAPDASQG